MIMIDYYYYYYYYYYHYYYEGNTTIEEIQEYKSKGVDDVLCKPVSLDMVKKSVLKGIITIIIIINSS